MKLFLIELNQVDNQIESSKNQLNLAIFIIYSKKSDEIV